MWLKRKVCQDIFCPYQNQDLYFLSNALDYCSLAVRSSPSQLATLRQLVRGLLITCKKKSHKEKKNKKCFILLSNFVDDIICEYSTPAGTSKRTVGL